MSRNRHDDGATTRDRAKTAAVAGAGVAAGLAIGAALFAGWRKGAGARPTGAQAEGLDGEALPTPPTGGGPDVSDAIGAGTGSAGDPTEDKLHAMGTPTTLPVDGGVQRYTGDAAPDMAVDYLPGADTGATDAADTRDRP
jgi:hypothetical protein